MTLSKKHGYYKTHIFCCVNNNQLAQSDKETCGKKNADELHAYFKQKCKDLKILDLRVNKSGCLGRCKLGKVMVIYPDSIWYHYDTKEDIDEIIETHIINGKICERLKLADNQFKLEKNNE